MYLSDPSPPQEETSCEGHVDSQYHCMGTILSPMEYDTTRMPQWL
jgi:hypothetical protein